jgi:aminoglycoside phosphotransferase (APT) family kinase protein
MSKQPSAEDLLRPPPPQTLHWVTTVIGTGSRITRLRPIRHGGWHANHALVVLDRHGRRHRLVLRRWARPDWAVDDPDFTVAREVTILTLLADAPVPAPQVVAADLDAAACDAPALLLARLPGRPPLTARSRDLRDFRGFLTQLAEALPPIHALNGNGRAHQLVPAYRTYQDLHRRPLPAWLGRSPVWEQAFVVATGPPPAARPCLIHRDYHPGNTLWWQGQLTGVVDWTQGSWGPPGIDVGWMRWNLACDYGLEAAEQFLGLWEAASGSMNEHHPYWDVLTAVDLVAAMDPDPPLRDEGYFRLVRHVTAALSRL